MRCINILVLLCFNALALANSPWDPETLSDERANALLRQKPSRGITADHGASHVQTEADGSSILLEKHSDGGSLVPGRSWGQEDEAPFINIVVRNTERHVRIHWKTGNARVGEGFSATLAFMDEEYQGTCYSAACFLDVDVRDHERAFHAILVQFDQDNRAVLTNYRSKAMIPAHDADGDVRTTHRQQTCLESPRSSAHGELFVVDVVYSTVHRQIVIFGPTMKPLGGLYCVWDNNPQTSGTARKVCHNDRIPDDLRRSWIWVMPPQGARAHNIKGRNEDETRGILFQCVFDEGAEEVVSNATLIVDNQLSHNLATCFLPEGLNEQLTASSSKQGAWTKFRFRAVDTRIDAVVAEVSLPLCPNVISVARRLRFDLSICAIFRDQAPYLAEWVEYHLLAGVQHMYLYNHKSVDNASLELYPYVKAGVVDLHQWDLPGHPQKEAFIHCTHKYGHETRWMAMIDVDEFLLAEDGQRKDVKQVLQLFEQPDALLYVQEMFYGHQNFSVPPSGLVIENYLNHSDDISKFSYRKKYIFRPVDGNVFIPCIHDIASGVFEAILLPPDILRINHYTVKSRRHWQGDHIKRYQPCTEEWNEVYETTIADVYLHSLKLAMCKRLGRLYDGKRVYRLPNGRTCEEEISLITAKREMLQDACAMCLTKEAHSDKLDWISFLRCLKQDENLSDKFDVEEVNFEITDRSKSVIDETDPFSIKLFSCIDLYRTLLQQGQPSWLNHDLIASLLQVWLAGFQRGQDIKYNKRSSPREAEQAETTSPSHLLQDVEGDVEGPPQILILHPPQGATVLTASLTVSVINLPRWSDCCDLQVYMDLTFPRMLQLVATISSPSNMTVTIDRNRTAIPFGPSWHTVSIVLVIRGEDNSEPLAQVQTKLRFTGPRKLEERREGSKSPAPAQDGGRKRSSRARFPVAYPQVCAGFLSSRRLHLLRRSISALVKHFEEHEADIPYELVWVDNDSGEEAMSIYKEFDFERVALYKINYGATHGLNTLIFDLCSRSEYVMTMEEDWEWKEDKTHIPIVSMAIQVLREDKVVVGVLFREELDYKAELTDWMTTSDGIEYRRHCMKVDSMGWGAWTNGAAIWKRKFLEEKVGRQNEDWGDGAELEYAQRVGRRGCAAQIRVVEGCETTSCNSVARHIGETATGQLQRSPGWEQHAPGFEN